MGKRLAKSDFTKQDTQALKGIAILMMLFHHCYRTTEIFEGYTVNFAPFSEDFIVKLAYFMKICVAIFVFITGYGLTKSIKAQSENYTLDRQQFKGYIRTRLVKVMSGYWFVYICASIFCFFMDNRQLTVYFEGDITRDNFATGFMRMLLDMFGLTRLFNLNYWRYTLNADWWYMSLAILLVLLAPLIVRLVHKYAFLWTALLCLFVPRIFGLDGSNDLVRWIFMFIIGVYSAQNDVLQKMKDFCFVKNRPLNMLLKFGLSTVILAVLCYTATKLDHKAFYEFKDGMVPFFVIYYCYNFIICIPVVRQILCFFGRYAMTVYFVHDIIKEVYFGDFVYSFEYFGLIYIIFFAISLAVAIVLEFLKKITGYNKLINLIVQKLSVKSAVSSV